MRRTAAEDTHVVVLQNKTDSERDVNIDFNVSQFQWFTGGAAVVTLLGFGGALLGCRVGKALVTPLRSDPSLDPEGLHVGCILAAFPPEMIYGCLGGWYIGFTGSFYGIYSRFQN